MAKPFCLYSSGIGSALALPMNAADATQRPRMKKDFAFITFQQVSANSTRDAEECQSKTANAQLCILFAGDSARRPAHSRAKHQPKNGRNEKGDWKDEDGA